MQQKATRSTRIGHRQYHKGQVRPTIKTAIRKAQEDSEKTYEETQAMELIRDTRKNDNNKTCSNHSKDCVEHQVSKPETNWIG